MRTTVLGLFVLTGCADMTPGTVEFPADSAAGEVSFEMAGMGGAALVVPVHVNGEGPLQFVLDTGATVTCVDQSLATRLELPPVRGVVGTGAGIGSSGQVSLVTMESMRIGNAVARDIDACVVDLGHLEGMNLELDGLVGLNFLREYDVSLDFQRNIVTFTAPEPAR